ncbi:PC-esterase domain-containing protein 1B [Portunus trituberculatus]|uniref:PC-esterase domain-containing protein 1B n=1 Tax=Portunus trituberculatus TaxID=210409 RepID=A0A5B7CZY5_PORTR|nr:PC-esterase domain-containing protein 1B [Portunus trituberculatus]
MWQHNCVQPTPKCSYENETTVVAPQYGDEMLKMASLRMGRSYFEVRQCKKKDLWLRFIFVTQVAAPTLMKELKSIEEGKLPPPDIVVVNSCLWDITRWGPEQEDQYKQNVANLFHRLQCLLPPASLVVWLASLPVATERVKGGVFIQQVMREARRERKGEVWRKGKENGVWREGKEGEVWKKEKEA